MLLSAEPDTPGPKIDFTGVSEQVALVRSAGDANGPI